MTEVREQVWAVRLWLLGRVAAWREDDRESGQVPEWVIITAVMVVLALAIGGIIVAKVTDKANTINLQ